MAEYVTVADVNVALNGTIPFNTVSIPCNSGSVIPVAPGILSLRGGTNGRFARYDVRVQGNISVPEEGELTPIALAITLDGVALPESVAIFTPQAVDEYGHINTVVPVTVPCGCCFTVSGTYYDATEDDADVTPTPSINVRRGASISVVRTA